MAIITVEGLGQVEIAGDTPTPQETDAIRKALDSLSASESHQLKQLFTVNLEDNIQKIETVKAFFVKSGSAKATQQEIESYTNKAFSVLETLNISEDKKMLLKDFGNSLMTRKV